MRKSIVGIYVITNKENGKKYIGSSRNIANRWYDHTSKLKRGVHGNTHLQRAWDKYGSVSFKFEILEEVPIEELLDTEQKYILSYDFSNLYNLTLDVYGGGADTLKKDVLLLNLDGLVYKTFTGGSELAKFLGVRQIVYCRIDTEAIVHSKYRIVTPMFYEENQDIVKSWKPIVNISKHKSDERRASRQYYKVTDGERSITTSSGVAISLFLKISKQRANQMLNSKVFKANGVFINKKTNIKIEKII